MNLNRITVRYAKALFQTALEEKKTKLINNDMKLFMEAAKIPDFKLVLDNPVILASKKISIFKDIFSKKTDNLSIKFLELLTTNNREQYLENIARNYLKIFRDFYGIKSVNLTTAVSISKELQKEISDIISIKFKTKVELTKNVDNDIVGGFILRVEDNIYDTSVTGKLKQIKTELLQS